MLQLAFSRPTFTGSKGLFISRIYRSGTGLTIDNKTWRLMKHKNKKVEAMENRTTQEMENMCDEYLTNKEKNLPSLRSRYRRCITSHTCTRANMQQKYMEEQMFNCHLTLRNYCNASNFQLKIHVCWCRWLHSQGACDAFFKVGIFYEMRIWNALLRMYGWMPIKIYRLV